MTIPTSDRLSSARSENSLYCLTKKFVKMIRASKDKIINLTTVAVELGVHKRRVYDITNVLEGLGLLGKWSVNSAKWIGENIDDHIENEDEKENLEYNNEKHTSNEEINLDKQIVELNTEIYNMSQCKTNLENAFVTFQDLQKLDSLKNKMIFSVKAPSDTIMEAPKYEKGVYKMNFSAESGNIMVYYVSEEN